jgi:hypothetical protein
MSTTKKDIERHEQELMTLLQDVMQAPLDPIKQATEKIESSVLGLGILVQEFRKDTLASIDLNSVKSEKKIRPMVEALEEISLEQQGIKTSIAQMTSDFSTSLQANKNHQEESEERIKSEINSLKNGLCDHLKFACQKITWK